MAVKKRLLLVDDDEALRGELVEQFAVYEEFETHDVGTATAGIEAAKAQTVRDIRLTEKETNILKYLYRAGGKPVAREELLEEVWGYNSGVTTHTLETHVYRLRQKIEPERGTATLLMTEPGGYRLAMD